jgi:hypothetical protein
MIRALLLLALMVFAAAACSNPNAIAAATLTNELDTDTLYSLMTGPLTRPSAYSLNVRNAVRIYDVGTAFEFAFSMDSTGKAVFLPLDVLGLAGTGAVKPGLLPATLTFDAMTEAPLNGYITSDTIPIAEGDRFFLRTAINTCASLGVPLYGKLQVLDIDTVTTSVTLQVVANQNCGYRGLGLGIPKN